MIRSSRQILRAQNIQNQWLLYKKIFNKSQSSSKLFKTKYKEVYNTIDKQVLLSLKSSMPLY